MTGPTIEALAEGVVARCTCGWEGDVGTVENWAVERENDRVVRRCPGCDEPRPEWGTFRPLDGVRRVARGPLRDALRDAGAAE